MYFLPVILLELIRTENWVINVLNKSCKSMNSCELVYCLKNKILWSLFNIVT